jgi:hypothetical protein
MDGFSIHVESDKALLWNQSGLHMTQRSSAAAPEISYDPKLADVSVNAFQRPDPFAYGHCAGFIKPPLVLYSGYPLSESFWWNWTEGATEI